MWESKSGVSVQWAQHSFKTTENEQGIYNVSTTDPRYSRGAQLNNPTITTKLTSPDEGIIGVEHYHHYSKYANSKESRFDLNIKEGASHFKVLSDDKVSSLNADGNIQATLQKENSGIDFKDSSNGKLLTKLGFRSVGWVSDPRYPQDDGKPSTYTHFQLHISNGEKFYGLGERFGPFVKNGQRVEMWNEDGGTSSEWTYKNIPFFISSRGYGVFIDSSSDVIFEIQSERTTRINVTIPNEGARYYIINGPDPKTILKRYAKLTGFPALPPAWTFGLWLTTSFTTDYDVNTVSSFIQGMKDRNIPLRTFHFDCFWMKGLQWCDFQFDPEFFPNPKQMLADLKKKFGIKVCVWINSYIGQESSLFKECDEKGYLIKNTDGSSYQTDLWQAGMGIVDFTNPEAYKWFQDQLKGLVDLGVDTFKTDFGERIPVKGVKYHSGQDPVAMHNYYTYLYNKSVFEVLEQKLGKNEACLFARSATVGGQQFPVHWGGDCESSFEAMAETLRGGLSLGLSGFGFWSHDISGFEGSPDPSLYKRWVAFGLLSSHSRLHGSSSYRVPWNFDDESSDVLRRFTNLKLSLMPYIYAKAIEAHETATPVQRALLLEFFDDVTASQVDDAFMLGDKILVAPITNEEGDIDYYIPKGDWYGYLDGKVRSSRGEYFHEVHDFQSLPFLIRPNSVFVSTGLDIVADKPDYDYNEDVLVNIFGLEDGDHVVGIPDIKKLGKFAGQVKVNKQGGKITVDVASAKKLSVRLLNVKDVTKTDGEVGKDEFDNVVIKSKRSKVTIEI
jgi:alpha-D-xyloside xylohydrolase